jgi:hypothetical protein
MLPVLTFDASAEAQLYTDRGENGFGPTPQLRGVAGAVAFGREIPLFDPPSLAPNVSYAVTANSPLVRCQAANETEQSRLLIGANQWVHAPPLTNNSAKWPSNTDTEDASEWRGSGELCYLAVYDQYDNVTMGQNDAKYDKIMVALQRRPTESEYQSDTEYMSCSLWNATLSFSVNFTSGRSRVENVAITWHNQVDRFVPYNKDSFVPHEGYNAYFAAVAKYIVGIGHYNTTNSRNHDLVTTTGDVFASTLSYNSQFRNMTVNLTRRGDSEPQIINNQNLRNTSFGHDLEELALNTTISLFANSQFR